MTGIPHHPIIKFFLNKQKKKKKREREKQLVPPRERLYVALFNTNHLTLSQNFSHSLAHWHLAPPHFFEVWFCISNPYLLSGIPSYLSQKRICLQCRRPRFDSWFGKIPLRRKWQSTLVFSPGEYHGRGA